MRGIVRIAVLVSSIMFLTGIPWTVSAQTEEAGTLEELEALAQKMFAEGLPERSLELYKRYERQMAEEGWDGLNADVLSNLAITSYHAGRLGESMAYSKQLYILQGSKEIRNEIDELQMLIEHKVYQTSPNTAFVRGESSDYTIWEFVNRFTQFELHLYVILVWSLFFIFLSGLYFVRGKGKLKYVFIDLMLLTGGCLIILCSFLVEQQRTDSLRFGVITSVESLVDEPGYEARKVNDPSYIPGMTVSVVSHIPGWVKFERVDGETSWVKSSDIYLLRGKGDRRASQLE